MKKWMRAFVLICVFCIMMSSSAQAASLIEQCKESARQRSSVVSSSSSRGNHNFWFWSSDKYVCYAQWERVSGGVNFKIKMKNNFPQDSVDAYRFEISAEDAFEEPIKLEASDGGYYSSLYYDGDRTFRPGTNGYTESFRLRSNDKIRYVKVKLIKYHTDEGTVDVDKSHQREYHWKID